MGFKDALKRCTWKALWGGGGGMELNKKANHLVNYRSIEEGASSFYQALTLGSWRNFNFFFKFNLKFSTHERQCMNGSSTVVKLPTARNCHPFFSVFSSSSFVYSRWKLEQHSIQCIHWIGINSTFYWTKEERATRKSQCEWHRNNRYRRGRFCGQGDETRRRWLVGETAEHHQRLSTDRSRSQCYYYVTARGPVHTRFKRCRKIRRFRFELSIHPPSKL